MQASKIDLKHNIRDAMAELLNARLADALDLRGQLYQAHWNVKGPHFLMLHQLFDTIGTELETDIDDLAERVTALGGRADGTPASVAKRSTLPKYPESASGESDHVKAIVASLAAFGASIRAAIDAADEAGDKGTADLFTSMSRGLDKKLWIVETHLADFR
ncbi:MAG: DNA starvation/stationary phase protection protein Dps [Alphaproteobacteria bacterium]